MAYPAQADWSSVDWSLSDRDIAARLGVTHRAVEKRRARLGHSSDYKIDAMLLRGWFESSRKRMPRMSDEDIQVEVFDVLDIYLQKPQVCYWRKLMNPRIWAQKARRAAAGAGVVLVWCWCGVGVVLVAVLLGCKGYMQDDAKFEVGFKTMLSFEQIGPADKGTRSEMGVDAQDWLKKPAVEWFIDSDGDGEFDQSGEPGEDE